MQPPIAPPRNTLTLAQVVALIQDAAGITVSGGAELVDASLNKVEDFTDDLAGGSVTRTAYATLHGTAQLAITRVLDWGAARVRPYIILDSGVTAARWNLGVYYTSTPVRDLEEQPITFDVQCYDVLSILNDPVGDAYAVAAGVGYLAAVEAILLARGVAAGAYLIDQALSATVLPTDRVWAFDETITWLTICNNLLASIGYAGLWSDWDGRIRAEPYQTPRTRAPEWLYDDGTYTSMLGTARTIEHDYFAVPNRWVFYRSNNIDSTAPTDGNGRYVYQNDFRGETSVQARGRVITRVVGLDVADHTSLVNRAQMTIDADMTVPTKWKAVTSPNPLHWHFDRMVIQDTGAGPPVDVVGTQWTLPLDGGGQTHEWTVLG